MNTEQDTDLSTLTNLDFEPQYPCDAIVKPAGVSKQDAQPCPNIAEWIVYLGCGCVRLWCGTCLEAFQFWLSTRDLCSCMRCGGHVKSVLQIEAINAF